MPNRLKKVFISFEATIVLRTQAREHGIPVVGKDGSQMSQSMHGNMVLETERIDETFCKNVVETIKARMKAQSAVILFIKELDGGDS